MIRVAVADDHPHVAIALRALLAGTPDIKLVAEARPSQIRVGREVMTEPVQWILQGAPSALLGL